MNLKRSWQQTGARKLRASFYSEYTSYALRPVCGITLRMAGENPVRHLSSDLRVFSSNSRILRFSLHTQGFPLLDVYQLNFRKQRQYFPVGH